jgi:hypothetical protein
MANRTVRYHTEHTMVEAIHRLITKSAICRVAVAYCGEKAYCFFPEKPDKRPPELRVVLDAAEPTVSRGLTNPKGILHLVGLPAQVRSLAGLHAKVFIFDERAALVGSANMSEQSIENQYQMGLEVSDTRVVRQLARWFDQEIWHKAQRLDVPAIRKLQSLWPRHVVSHPARHGWGTLPRWHGPVPEPALGPSDFVIGVSKREINRLLSEFRNNECVYLGPDGGSCADCALQRAGEYQKLGEKLRRLVRRRKAWDKQDLDKLFDIAFDNGRAGSRGKPAFVRLRPEKVARSIEYLLLGSGDPYIRYERVLAKGSPYKLRGMGPAGTGLLMHLWAPQKFAVINGSTLQALKALKVSFGRAASQRKGQAFKDQTAAVEWLAKLTRLRSFARVDHFLDAIAKKHIHRPR